MTLWIDERDLMGLSRLPVDEPPSGPDASVHVEAMAAYVAFSGAQVALPTLRAAPGGERLADGARLVRALRAARWERPVACILRAPGPAPEGAEPFSEEAAGRRGADAVLLTLSRPPTNEEIGQIARGRPAQPRRVGSVHLGWPSLAAAHAGGWTGFVNSLKDAPVPVAALNGRFARWRG